MVPVLSAGLGLWTNDDRWRLRAEAILEQTTRLVAAAGISCDGRLADADLLQALDDVLRTGDVAEVVVVGSPSRSRTRLGQELPAVAVAHRLERVTVVPAAPTPPSPPGALRRQALPVAAVVAVSVLLAVAAIGSGRLWLLADIAFVLAVVALNVGSKIAVLAALWVALRRRSRRPPPGDGPSSSACV